MREHESYIRISTEELCNTFRVPAALLLREVAERIDLSAARFVFAEDETGQLLGLADAEEISRRLASWNDTERKRWAETPLESILSVRLQPEGQGGELPREPDGSIRVPGSALSHDDRLVALDLGDDVLIRWSSVRNVLEQALYDAVTGLPNRAVFDRRLREEWARVRRTGSSIAVMMIDLDHFKDINDHHGHAMGDEVLRDVADNLLEQFRSYDLLARYGGDEFAAILTDCDMNAIHIPVARVQAGLEALAHKHHFQRGALTVSIGAVSCTGMANLGATRLLDAADECLYAAKRAGRGCGYTMEIRDAEETTPRPLDSFSPIASTVPRRPR